MTWRLIGRRVRSAAGLRCVPHAQVHWAMGVQAEFGRKVSISSPISTP